MQAYSRVSRFPARFCAVRYQHRFCTKMKGDDMKVQCKKCLLNLPVQFILVP